jgi:hypothetical protein
MSGLVVALAFVGAAVGAAAGVLSASRQHAKPAPPKPVPAKNPPAVEEPPAWLAWLADAPLFIDKHLVGSFFDATVRPTYEPTSVEVSKEVTWETSSTLSGEATATLFPGLSLTAGAGLGETHGESDGHVLTMVPVTNSSRELLRIVLHYHKNHSAKARGKTATATQDGRIWQQLGLAPEDWKAPSKESIEERPRMIAFLDFPVGSKFIPVAIETDEGVGAVHQTLIKKLQGDDPHGPPSYSDDSGEDAEKARAAYWKWIADRWDPMAALIAVETDTKDKGRVRWVNYRVWINDGLTLHLNVVGHGEYDIGVFAYNLIKRGARQGLRIVGTVRSDPGLNVLAIYDK